MSVAVLPRQLSFAEAISSYPPRNPAGTILYKVVQENLETFIQEIESNPSSKGLPQYVKREFYEYLRCGILACGFLRLQCQECKHESILPFSCKGRGFCPSCGGRRMNELAAFLVDEVIPHVPIRQVVLSFPFPVRFWISKNPTLQSQLLTITIRAYSALLRKKAKAQGITQKLEYAVVTVIQRMGGSINLNPHLYSLWVDGLYDVSQKDPVFVELPPPTDEEIIELVSKISNRIVRCLKRKGYKVDEFSDENQQDDELFAEVQSASVQSLIAFGERRGQKVRRIGMVESASFEGAVLEGERCASHNGFSLHANVCCGREEREKLEHMLRYIARPPVAIDRLGLRPDGLITYRLKKRYRDGTEMLLFSPIELLEKLSALVPRPRVHSTRYHGLFAPHSKARSKIVLRAQKQKEETRLTDSPSDGLKKQTRMSWAKLLNRVFKVDLTHCRFCRGEIKVVAAIMEKTAIEKILSQLWDFPPNPQPSSQREVHPNKNSTRSPHSKSRRLSFLPSSGNGRDLS